MLLSLKLLPIAWILCSASRVFAQSRDTPAPDCLQSLLRAYPDALLRATNDSLYWRNGAVMPFGRLRLPSNLDTLSTAEWECFLSQATLRDQMAQCYKRNDSATTPLRHDDPGRIRFEPFFRTMYGASENEVRQNLVPVRWLKNLPNAASTLMVTRINGVNTKLEAISDELERLPKEFHQYIAQPAGTFKWRVIAGTERLSNHSFAAAIDINLRFTDYWRWDLNKGDRYPFKNRIPMAIVHIFEKHGFIWGGRWYHYDTMHFEYRPELLTKECGCKD
jgi:peptidoglycan LD-endopeptidase CwlK